MKPNAEDSRLSRGDRAVKIVVSSESDERTARRVQCHSRQEQEQEQFENENRSKEEHEKEHVEDKKIASIVTLRPRTREAESAAKALSRRDEPRLNGASSRKNVLPTSRKIVWYVTGRAKWPKADPKDVAARGRGKVSQQDVAARCHSRQSQRSPQPPTPKSEDGIPRLGATGRRAELSPSDARSGLSRRPVIICDRSPIAKDPEDSAVPSSEERRRSFHA